MADLPANGADDGDAAGSAPRSRRQTVADADQTSADADQTAADLDQTAADVDQAVGDRDQESSNRDRHLSEADQRASDRDQQSADTESRADPSAPDTPGHRARQATRRQRAQTTAERARIATARTTTALVRFHLAEERDEAAQSRDLTAEARDMAAAVRDRLAAIDDDGNGAPGRRRAADDRARAASDREHAAGDRWETRLDRDDLRKALSEAHLDDLTGTYRRAMGMTALRSEIDRAHRSGYPLVMAFVGVNELAGFKHQHGDTAGDQLLVDVVSSIRANLRSYDPLVRFSTDQFVCALSETSLAEASARLDSIDVALAELHAGASLSVGFASLEPDDPLEAMIERGENALYDARLVG